MNIMILMKHISNTENTEDLDLARWIKKSWCGECPILHMMWWMSCVVNVCVLNAILLYLTRWNVKKKDNSSGKKYQSYKTNFVFWEELSGVLISTAKVKTKKKCCENTSEKSVGCCWIAPSPSLPLRWISYSSSPAISRDVFLVIISCDRSSLRYDGTVAPQFFFTL